MIFTQIYNQIMSENYSPFLFDIKINPMISVEYVKHE